MMLNPGQPTTQACSITPHPTDFHGHFIATFKPALNFDLAEIQTTFSETLVRFGVMPHNNSICQKIIQTFGRHALDLLRRQDVNRPQQQDTHWCRTEAEELELYCLWQFIDILSLLKPLEQHLGDVNRDESTIIDDCQKKLTDKLNSQPYKKFQTSQAVIQTLKQKLTHANTTLLKTTLNQIEDLKRNFDRLTPFDYQQRLHTLLHSLLNHFEEQQTAISVAQRGISNWLSIANGTNTFPLQTAYYLLQDHLYPANPATAEQLWSETLTSAERKQFDTARYPGIRQDDALFATCLVQAANKADNQDNSDNAYEPAKKNCLLKDTATHHAEVSRDIKTAHIAKKNELDQKRLESIDGWRRPWQWLTARLGWYRDSAIHHAFATQPLAAGKYAWWQVAVERRAQPSLSTADTTPTPTADTPTISSAIDGDLAQPALRNLMETWRQQLDINPHAFVDASPANIYKPSDIFSAFSAFGMEFAKYFNQELAAKHPALTTAAFITPATYWISSTLAGLQIAPHVAQAIYTTLSKILTMNGTLVDPHTLTSGFAHINHAWLKLTGADSAIESIILSGLGLPKLTVFAADFTLAALLKKSQGILEGLEQQLSARNIDVNSFGDEVTQKLKTLTTVVIALGFALALGISTPSLSQGGPLLKGLANLINFFDHVDQAALANALSSSTAAAQTVVQLKTASLFIGKIYSIHYLASKQPFARLPDAIHFFENTPNPQQDSRYADYRALLERALAEAPLLKASLGVERLNQWGIRDYQPAPRWLQGLWRFSKKVAGTLSTVVIGAIALLPSLGYLALTDTHTIPTKRGAAYVLKQAVKFCYGLLRGIPMFLLLGIKFFAIALGGTALRILVTGVHTLGIVLSFPVNVVERLYRYSLTNATGFLGVSLLSVVKVPLYAFESLSYGLSKSLLLPITGLVCWLLSRYSNQPFQTLWQRYQQQHHAISQWCDDRRSLFFKEYPDGATSQALAAMLFAVCQGISQAGIRLKNTLGRVALGCRNLMLRRLEHRLQHLERALTSSIAQPAAPATNSTLVTLASPNASPEEPTGSTAAPAIQPTEPTAAPVAQLTQPPKETIAPVTAPAPAASLPPCSSVVTSRQSFFTKGLDRRTWCHSAPRP